MKALSDETAVTFGMKCWYTVEKDSKKYKCVISREVSFKGNKS